MVDNLCAVHIELQCKREISVTEFSPILFFSLSVLTISMKYGIHINYGMLEETGALCYSRWM